MTIHIVPLGRWAFSLPTRAEYYGYRWGLYLGRWLILIGRPL